MRLSFKYRCYPNVGTRKRAYKAMRVMADVWNIALKERQDSYEESKKSPDVKPINSYYKQYHLIRKREHPEYKYFNAQSLQDVLCKLDGSYKSFFDLTKKDPSARPPKEKRMHYNLVYQQSGWVLDGKTLHLRHIGRFKIRMHRPVEGKIKTVTVSVDRGGRWYVCLSCELEDVKATQKPEPSVTISFPDLGFIVDSSGHEIGHPEFYFTEIDYLRRLSRSLSRKKKGSKNRRKAKHTLNKWHQRIANKRKYFIEQTAKYYIDRYNVIYVPKMPLKQKIQHASTSRKAMMLCDAAYASFVTTLKNMAKKTGKAVEEYALSNKKTG